MAKKDIYTSSRCMTSGILLGRLAGGLAAFEKALENKEAWSPAYAVGRALSPALPAAKGLERLLPGDRPKTKSLTEIIGQWANQDSYGFNREKASLAVKEIRDRLGSVARVAIEACGKRRPSPDDADALLRMKRAKKRMVVEKIRETQAPPLNLVLEPVSEGAPWGIIAGVLLVIGATFWVGRPAA